MSNLVQTARKWWYSHFCHWIEWLPLSSSGSTFISVNCWSSEIQSRCTRSYLENKRDQCLKTQMLTSKKCGSRLWSLVPNKASIGDTSDNIKFVSLSYFIGYVACQSIWLDKMCGILCMLACKLNKLFPLMVLWDHIYQMHCYWMKIALCDSSCTYTLKSYTMHLQTHVLWKDCLNSDGQQFHLYQQNEYCL